MGVNLELVAKAMFKADNKGPEPAKGERGLPRYRAMARAAIEAMQETTLTMIRRNWRKVEMDMADLKP